MLRYLRCILLFIFCFGTAESQIAVNEIIFTKEKSIQLELFNNNSDSVYLQSVLIKADTIEIVSQYEDLIMIPFNMTLLEFEDVLNITGINMVSVIINTSDNQYLTEFKGYIMAGESAGRNPDIDGDFIIYNNDQISPGKSNFVPGILVKKTSKTSFTPRDSSPNAALYCNNYYWIFGGWDYDINTSTFSSKSNIWKSTDGIKWSLVNESPPFSHYSGYLAFNNKMLVYYLDSVYVSEDGIHWDAELLKPIFPYTNSRYTVFKDKIYLLNYDKIGISSDGINWTFYDTNIDVYMRVYPAFVASEDKLWVYGGTGLADVWSSNDGITWIKLLDEAPWSKRKWFNYTYFDKKIWMIAGHSSEHDDNLNFGNLRDFWYSSDGIDWHLLESDSSYHNRHASFLWNDGDRVLLSSGFGNNSVDRMYNDVWELSVKNLYLTENEASSSIDLSIFPHKSVNYTPADYNSLNIRLNSSLEILISKANRWFDKNVLVGNGVDPTEITFKNSGLVNIEKWKINSQCVLTFTGLSVLNNNPDWKPGSVLLIKDLHRSDLGFKIDLPFLLKIDSSKVNLSPESSALIANISSSHLNPDAHHQTVFRSRVFNLSNSAIGDSFWLTNLDSARLNININDYKFCVPNIVIGDSEFKLKSDLPQLNKVKFIRDVLLNEKLDINQDGFIYLSGNVDYLDRVMDNIISLPTNLILDRNSSLKLENAVDMNWVDFFNMGYLDIGNNELQLKSYFEDKGIVSIDEYGTFYAGFNDWSGYSEINLTIRNSLSNDLTNPTYVKLRLISDEYDTKGDLFSFSVYNSADIYSDIKADEFFDYYDLTLKIEKVNHNNNNGYSLFTNIANQYFSSISYYNYLFEYFTRTETELEETTQSDFYFSDRFLFGKERMYTFLHSRVDLQNSFIYPNPTNGIIRIDGKLVLGLFSLKIFDLSGKLIYSSTYNNQSLSFEKDYTKLFKFSGLYIFRISNLDSGKTLSRKIAINKL